MCIFFVVVYFIVSTAVNTAIFLPDLQAINRRDTSRRKDYREDLGDSVFFAALISLIPLIGTIIALLSTGFAKHGFYIRYRNSEG